MGSSLHKRKESVGRKPAVWTLRVELSRVDGKRRWKSETVKGNERKARERLQEMANEVETTKTLRPAIGGKGVTLAQLFEVWLNATKSDGNPRAKSSCYQERRRFERHVAPVLGPRSASSISKQELKDLYSSIGRGSVRPYRAPLSPESVHRVHELVRSVYAEGLEQELVSQNPALSIRRTKSPTPAPKAPSLRSVQTLMGHLEHTDYDLYCAVFLAASVGARRSEILALQWRDLDKKVGALDLTSGLIRVPGIGQPVFTDTKTGEGALQIPLERHLVRALKEMYDRRLVAAGDALVCKNDRFMFPANTEGTIPIHPDVFTKRLKTSQVNVTGLRTAITWKDLRAFAATELARHEEGIHVAQAVLRHKSLITTLKFYASVRTTDLQRATKKHGMRLIDTSVGVDSEPPWWEDDREVVPLDS